MRHKDKGTQLLPITMPVTKGSGLSCQFTVLLLFSG